MKITKKMIILLIMIMGFLMLGMPSVDAKELPTTGNYVSTSYKKLKVGEDYKVTYGMYGQLKNLFCAEHGQRMWSVGRDYKVIAHFKIINSTSWEINSKGEKIKGSKLSTANKKFSKDYNKKLATGITTLKGNQQKYFIWGYLKTWIKHVGAKSEHVPSNFATQYQPGNYGDILEKVEDDILDSDELDQDELNDATDYNKITYLTVKIGNTEYERVGPFKISGIPKDGLKSMRVQNQDGKEISNAKIAQYKDGQIKEVKASEIKSNKNFYICLPKDIYITKIKAIASAKKFVPTGDSGVEADIYLLKCHDYTWQNLVVTDGEPFDTLTQLQEVPLELKTISMPGDLTIIKTGDGSTLPGATFAIFKYVKNDNGDWYKKGDTYTQNVNEATDKSTKYRRAYLCSQGPNKPYLYEQVGMNGTVKGDPNYHFTTGLDGKITLHDLQPGEYFATELKAPQGYKKIDTFFKLGQVKSLETLTKQVDNQPETTNLDLTKVDANNQELVLEGVGFKFKHPTKGWLKKDKDAQGNAQYTNNESEAKTWKTDANGKIHLEGIEVGTWEYKEDPDTVPEGYSIGTGTGTFQLRSTATNSVTITNKQEFVKLSGFVWVDRAGVKSGDGKDRNDLFKTGPQPDERDLLFDGITVKLKDKRNGSTVDQKVTSQLNRYTETGHNGHGEYLFENVKIDELENYYIEFTYDGLNYTNVVPHLDYINNGSKATESEQDRTTLNNKFSRIEGKTENTGIAKAKGKDGQETALSYEIKQDKDGQKAILNNDGECTEYDSYIVQNKLGDFGITAHTNATNYSIKANFVPGQSEIKYINLGLKDRDRPDISLGKDLENIRLSINGYQHVYEYHQYLSHPLKEEADDAFNVGVRYKNQHTESYKRAIYKADYEYVNEQNKKQELEVYVTYKLEMSQSNPNLKAQINSINDYFDAFYTLERVGTEIDKNKNVGGTIITQRDNNGVLTGGIKEDRYGDGKKYKKVTIPCDMLIDQAQISKDLYVQFKLSREGVLEILGDKKEGEEANDNQLLDNVAEINSYSIFDATGKAYAGVDKDSNPGNCNPLEKDETKREDDTDSSAPIKLEVANARVMTGKVFIDHHEVKNKENPNGVMTGIIRQGNGKYDDGKEESVNGVTVELRDSTTGKIVQVYNPNSKGDNDKWMDARVTTGSGKDKDGKAIDTGDFYISNYIPGQYVVTYTWGGQTYTLNGQPEEITVQNYKGTVYVDQKRYEDNKNNKKWWHVKQTDPVNGTKEASERLTDAIDNYNTDQEAPKGSRIQIDEELKNLNKDVTLQNRLRKQMESTTLPMEIGVEYDTTYSASKGDKYVYKIDNIDFGIIERPKQDLLLTKRVKSMKVTLANGQVIANLTVKENGEITGEKNGVTYMKPNNNLEPKNGFIRLELDNELIQGTKLEVEYEIAVKNNSEKDFVNEVFYKFGTDYTNPVTITPTGMIDYLDKNWSFDSQNGENKKWQVMKVDDEFKKLVIDDVHDSNKNKVTTIGQKLLLYTNQLAGEKLATGEHREITFNVSKILTTTDEIELNNEVEEVTATKTGGAMIQSTLGNYVPGSGPTESDDSMAETTIVTPATGDNRDYILPIIIGATALIILGAGVIIIKKKVI